MSRDHDPIEVPAAFKSDCESCPIACDREQEQQCIRTETAYREGYKAAIRKFDVHRHILTRVTVYNQVAQQEEVFCFLGCFEIVEGTKFVLDTKTGRYFQAGRSRLLTDAGVHNRLQFCTLRKLEVQVTDTPVLGKGGVLFPGLF